MNIMAKILLSAFLFLISTYSIAGGCDSGQNSRQAYTALSSLNFPPLSITQAPIQMVQVKNQLELNDLVNKLQRELEFVKRIERMFIGCLSGQGKEAFIKEVARKELEIKANGDQSEYQANFRDWLESGSKTTPINNFSSAKDMANIVFAKIDEALALTSRAEANIKLEAEKRTKEIAKAQRKSEIAQNQLEQELHQIAELEASLEKERKLQRQLDEAKSQKQQLEADKAQYQNKRKNNNQQALPSTKSNGRRINNQSRSGDGYIKEQGVFCLSKPAFDRQIEFLSRNQMQYASGCYSTPTRQNVWLKDFSWNGECVLERTSDERQLWTFCEDYEDW